MTVLAGLLKFYFKLENKYYKLCDYLEKKGIAVYEYFVNPIESAGVPSFPVAVLALLLLAIALAWLAFLPQGVAALDLQVKVVGEGGSALQGANVSLLGAGNNVIATLATGSEGIAAFSGVQGALLVTATAEGYSPARVPVSQRDFVLLELQPVEQPRSSLPSGLPVQREDVNSFIVLEQFGSFQVSLKDSSTARAVNGLVGIYDASTDSLIREAASAGGVAVFENIELNQHVYFSAVVPGYGAVQRVEHVVRRERQEVELLFSRVETGKVSISVFSTEGNPLEGAEVRIFHVDNVPSGNFTTSANGTVDAALEQGKRFYFNARKTGYVSNVSDFFTVSGQSQNISLKRAGGEGASALRVNLLDEYNSSVLGVVSIYTSDNRIAAQSSLASQRHEFHLARGLAVQVKASNGSAVAFANVTLLRQLHSVDLNLEVRFAFLDVSAKNAITGESVAAKVEITRDGVLLSQCTSPCTAVVKTRGIHAVNVSTGGFFDYLFSYGSQRSHIVFEESSTTSLEALLMPLDAVRDSQILLDGVFDAVTFSKVQEGEALSRNRLYLAAMRGFYVDSTVASAFFSPSDADPANHRIVNFTPHPFESEVLAIGSESQLPDQCGSGFNFRAKWRRLLLSVPGREGTYTQPFGFYFVAEEKTSEPSGELLMRFKSFMQNQAGLIIRNPFDSALGTGRAEESGEKSECASQAFETSFALLSPNQARNSLGSLSLHFEQNRDLGALVASSPAPEKCGPSAFNAALENPFQFVDCNGFQVEGGFARPLEVHFKIELAQDSQAGKVKFSANPEFFTLESASFTIAGRARNLDPVPEGAVFEFDLSPQLAFFGGRREVTGVVTLLPKGVAKRSEIKVEFAKAGESISKTTWVKVTSIAEPTSESLLEGYSCSSASRVNFTYDAGLLATGTGWVGCSEIPLVVDPIFPADAVPLYVENTIGNSECAITEGGLQWSLADNNCFELDEETAAYGLAEIPGFKSFVLKYNALKPACSAVQGNSVKVQNTTLTFACTARQVQRGGASQFDSKTVKVTVLNTSGRVVSGLNFHPLLSTFTSRDFALSAGAVYFYPVPLTPPADPNAVSNCPASSTLVRVTQDQSDKKLFTDVFEYATDRNTLAAYGRLPSQCDLKNGSASNCSGFGIYSDLLNVGKSVYGSDSTRLCASPAPRERFFTELSTSSGLGTANARSHYSNALGRQTQRPYLSGQGSDVDFHLQCDYCAVSTLASENKEPPLGAGYAFAVAAAMDSETKLDPQVWLVRDNLQKLGPTRETLQFTYPEGVSPPASLAGLGQAKAIAIDPAFVVGGKLSVSEGGELVSTNTFTSEDNLLSKIYSPDGSRIIKPVLSYAVDASAVLRSTALRRSSSVFYCQAGGRNPLDSSQCRPTLADWIKVVPSPAFRSESCEVCQPDVNCDNQCNAVTKRYPDGRFCGNFCSAPQCYSAMECVGGQRTTALGGRATQSWDNSTRLQEVRLFSLADTNAPLKYFTRELKQLNGGSAAFNYTEVVNLGSECRDTRATVAEGTGQCFAPSAIRATLPNFAPTPEQAESMLKLSEKVGGCEYSSKWGRGYYKVTFSYVLQPNGQWQWQYSGEPLEVSQTYLQTGSGKCTAPALRGGDNSQLCYYTFATDSLESGKCVRSLRDYIPRTEDRVLDFNRDQYPENQIVYSTTGGTGIEIDEGVFAFTDSRAGSLRLQNPAPVNGAVYRYVRDLDLYSSNSLKCDAFSAQPLLRGKIPIVMLGGSSALSAEDRQTYIATFGLAGTDPFPGSFGVDKRGKVDFFRQVSKQSESICNELFTPREGWKVAGRSLFFALYGVDGQPASAINQRNLCAAACKIYRADGCPYVYSFNGDGYSFEHQAYPASGLEIEESYSFSALKFAKPQDNLVKLRSVQVLPETSYTNAIKVYAIDSPRNVTVIPDVNGVFHSIAKLEQPATAVNQRGELQLHFVAMEDDVYWQPLETGQSYLELGFNQSGDAKLYIVLSRAEALSFELASIRSAIGDNYLPVVMAVINALPKQVFDFVYSTWIKRKMALSVQVEENGKWIERASLRVGEPTYRLVYLPNFNGKVKLVTQGGYAVDYVAVDFSPDEKLEVKELQMETALSGENVSLFTQLRADDNQRWTQTPGEYVDVEFKDVPPKAGFYRFYSLAVKGYSVPLAGSNQTVEGFLAQAPVEIAKGVFGK